MRFDFDDILIKPAILSDIDSRSEINILDDNGMLPLLTAPMDTVIDKNNFYHFINNKIYAVMPRGNVDFYYSSNEKIWVSFGLDEFIQLFINTNFPMVNKTYVLIDIANGHMKKLYDTTKLAKERYGDKLVLMVGNIANVETYRLYSEIGVDYCRIGVGFGSGCLTSENTAIGDTIANLIKDTYEISCTLKTPAKIIADGGMRKYSDIIKSFALGADYVMLGGILNRALESCGETYHENIKHENWKTPGEQVDQYDETTRMMFKHGTKFYKKFRGMSTKDAQKSLGNKKIKTSEGVNRINPVEYTLDGWTENFKHYLSSALSYTGKKDLKDFIGKVEFNLISENSFRRYNK